MPHGGKRVGAGRKDGQVTKKTREIADKAIATGVSPLDVMLDNMRHFHKVAADAEAVLEGLTAEEYAGVKLDPADQFKLLLAEVKKAAGLRQLAQDSARDAAPYIHPRLTAVQHTGKNGEPLFDKMSPDELRDFIARETEALGLRNRQPSTTNGTGKPH